MSKPVKIVYPSNSTTRVAPLQSIISSTELLELNNLPVGYVQLTNFGQCTQISFISSGTDYSADSIFLMGIDSQGNQISETLVGPTANNTVKTVKFYQAISVLTIDKSIEDLQVNFNSKALPAFKFPGYQRTLTFTSTNNLSFAEITIVGTNLLGNSIMESIAGPNNNTVQTQKQYSQIYMITVRNGQSGGNPQNQISVGEGTGGILLPLRLDNYRFFTNYAFQIVVSGTLHYEVKGTLDNLETTVAGQGQVVNQNVAWINSLASGSVSAYVVQGQINSAVQCVLSASNPNDTGGMTFTFIQDGITS